MTETPLTGYVQGGVYITAFPGGRGVVHLSLDVVDRLLAEVMRGFGAVPKRGAEVGGILLGARTDAGEPVVRVLDFVLTAIEYRRGPSFLLSETDFETFAQALEDAHRHPKWKPVGFFRSQTRDSPGITEEDRAFFARFFPDAGDLLLLVRPHAARVSTAGFLARIGGELPLGAPEAEFPFRTRELDPAADREPPARGEGRRPRPELPGTEEERPPKPLPSGTVLRPRTIAEAAAPLKRAELSAPALPSPPPPPAPALPSVTAWTPEFAIEARQPDPRRRPYWSWLAPLLLAAALAAGYVTAQFVPSPWAAETGRYRLELKATTLGPDILIEWDRTSPLLSHARSASLEIMDGGNTQIRDLTPGELRSGNAIYQPSSSEVRIEFRVQSPSNTAFISDFTWRP